MSEGTVEKMLRLRIAELESQQAADREWTEKLRTAGQRMSNILYNLHQQPQLAESNCSVMKESVAEWDAAKESNPAATEGGR